MSSSVALLLLLLACITLASATIRRPGDPNAAHRNVHHHLKRRSIDGELDGLSLPKPDDCNDNEVEVGGLKLLVTCDYHDGTYILECNTDELNTKAYGITYNEAMRRFVATVLKLLAMSDDDTIGLNV